MIIAYALAFNILFYLSVLVVVDVKDKDHNQTTATAYAATESSCLIC